jgi:hypothetical protein
MTDNPEKIPRPDKWSCGFAEAVMGPDYKLLPLAIHVKNGIYYTQGQGFHNADGDIVIGLPANFMTPADHLRLANEEVSLRASLTAAEEPEAYVTPLDAETRAELLDIGKTAQEPSAPVLKSIHYPTLDITIEVIPPDSRD